MAISSKPASAPLASLIGGMAANDSGGSFTTAGNTAMGSTVTISTPDGSFSAYLACPKASRAPAIVVIQEIFGVNADMRKTCDGLAAQGYLAICPDLYWRQEPDVELFDKTEADWNKALALYTAFDVDAGVKDIAAVIGFVRSLEGNSGKVGAMGYCLGGLLAYLTATRTDADACVAYYGVGIDKLIGEAAQIRHPLLVHIAEEDEFVSKAAQAVMREGLTGHSGVEVHSYPGMSHAFARNNGIHYDSGNAALANSRTLAFFTATLL